MHIWTSPTDLTEDTYYDTREKMKAILCPTLIKLAPCIDVQFSLKLETDWKPDLLCREKSWAEPEVLLLPRLRAGQRRSASSMLLILPARITRENCRAFHLLSGRWFSSNSILSFWGSVSLSSLELPASSLLPEGSNHLHSPCWMLRKAPSSNFTTHSYLLPLKLSSWSFYYMNPTAGI